MWILLAGLIAGGSATGHESGVLGVQTLEWTAPNITRVISFGTYTRSPVMLASRAAPAHTETRAGRDCLVGGLFAFDVDDRFAFDIDETVTLQVTVDTTVSSGFVLLYDEATVSAGVRHARAPVSVGGRWQTLSVPLPRARFANRMRLQSDFVIAPPGSLFADPEGRWKGHEGEREVAICGLALARSPGTGAPVPAPGRLVLTVREEDGSVAPARVGLYDVRGRLPLPSASALPVPMFDDRVRTVPLIAGWESWPGAGREAFFVRGDYAAEVPAGDYELIVARGPEYRVAREAIHVEPGRTTAIRVPLRRWIDMPGHGWYSGDGHVHITRAQSDNVDILAFMQAEDVHVANLLQMGTLAGYYFPQYGFGPEARYLERTFSLVSGEEQPRTSEIGHHSGLNIRSFHAFNDYHRIDLFAQAVAREGGLFGYMHVNLEFGGVDRSMALGLPLGIGTHVEVLQAGMLNTRLMDDFLNMGFKVVPISGSDYPYITLPGADRTYVHVPGAFTADAWFEGLRAGHVFVTNGPILEFTVAGQGPGGEVAVSTGRALEVRVRASVNPDLDRIDRVELVAHGRVLAVAHGNGDGGAVEISYPWQPAASAWVTARAYGEHGTAALAGPIYVHRDGERWFGSVPDLACLVARYRAKVQELRELAPTYSSDPERWDYTRAQLLARWAEQRAGLEELIARAEGEYDALATLAPGPCLGQAGSKAGAGD